MAKPKITLYYDIVSPFAYMAFYALQNFSVFKQCEITYVPIFLGGLMKACNNVPPVSIKNKAQWVNSERRRWCTLFSIPILPKAPAGFPPLTLAPMRALTALNLHPALSARLPAATAALWDAYWVRGEDVAGDAGVLRRALAEGLGGDEEAVRELVEGEAGAGSKAVKEELVRRTEEAFAEGAFGLPWFVATNAEGVKEGFWGFDHLGQVVDFLELERPKEGGWRAML